MQRDKDHFLIRITYLMIRGSIPMLCLMCLSHNFDFTLNQLIMKSINYLVTSFLISNRQCSMIK